MTTKPKPKIKFIVPKITAKPKLKPEINDFNDLDDDLLAFPLLDLRDLGGISLVTETNEQIVQMLDSLIDYTLQLKSVAVGKDKQSHQRRISSFIRARDSIKDYPKEIKSGSQALKEIDGVGKGIASRIDEFLKFGYLDELRASIDPESKIIMELTEITGIGEVKAKSLINDFGIRSVDDLIDQYRRGKITVAKNQLTHHIAVGLEYYHDLKTRMSWDEADYFAQNIKSIVSDFNPRLIVEVCGSYRRMKETCGDIDVLITCKDDEHSESLPDIVTTLESRGLLVGHLTTKGKTKYMGVCMGPSKVGRRIDIRYVEYSSFGAAQLYFTGSGKFNKIMRYHANTRGYTLNEYGLYTYINLVKGETPIKAVSEHDIFKILGFVYLKPTERDF